MVIPITRRWTHSSVDAFLPAWHRLKYRSCKWFPTALPRKTSEWRPELVLAK